MSDGESEPNLYLDNPKVMTIGGTEKKKAGEPIQHLSLTRLTFETDCRTCYDFWIEYHAGGHFLGIETSIAFLRAGAGKGHYGQHIFAVEERFRREYVEARKAYYEAQKRKDACPDCGTMNGQHTCRGH